MKIKFKKNCIKFGYNIFSYIKVHSDLDIDWL